MTHRLTSNFAKNYCNRTLIVKVIVENVVTCFWGHSVQYVGQKRCFAIWRTSVILNLVIWNSVKSF